MIVLGEGAHLGGGFGGVEAQDLVHHEGVCQAVCHMVEGAQLVGHGVHYAEEGVGECHACHGGGVGDLLAGLDVVAVLVGNRQPGEQVLECLERKAVGVVRCHDGGDGLERVGHRVDAGGGGQALGGGHVVIHIHDRHIGHELIVGKRVLDAGLLVGDDGEGGCLTACTGGGGNADHIGLLAHLRELVDALADIREAHGHIGKVGLGVLVEDPHDLGRVHGGAAAERDDDIGLEGLHALGALSRAGEGRVVRYVEEAGMLDAQLLELLEDGVSRAGLVQVRAGNDEGALFAHLAQLVESNRQAALLDIDLFRRTEPEHVLPSFHHSLDVQQMLDAHVLGNRVAAPGAAAQGERRGKGEVIQVADAAVGGRGVDHDAAGLHAGLELLELRLVGGGVEVDGGGVAQAAALDQGVRLFDRVVKVLGVVHGEYRRELFVGKLLTLVGGLHLADEDLGALGNLNACERGDLRGGLADDAGVDGAVDDDGLADLLQLLAVEEVAAASGKLLAHLFIHLVQHDDRLLGGADHAVVEGLGVNDGVDRQKDVGGVVDDGGGVARADAESRGAGGVGGVDHAGAAGGEDDVRLLHEKTGHLTGRGADPADDVLGRASGDSCLQDDLGSLDGAALGAVVGADDDAVAGLEGQQRFKDGGGGGVRSRDDGADEAQRLGDFLHAVGFVLFDDAAGFGIAVGVVNILGGKVVLNDLIFHDAHAGLGDGGLGEGDAGLVGGSRGSEEDRVHLLLGVGGVDCLRGFYARDLFLQRFDGVNDRVFSAQIQSTPFLRIVKILTRIFRSSN